MKHLVGRLTVKGYQLSQFGLGGLVVAAETFVECDVFFFKITQVFEVRVYVKKHLFDLGGVDVSSQLVTAERLPGVLDVVLILEDEPFVVFKKKILFGRCEVHMTAELLLKFFVAFQIQLSLMALEPSNVGHELVIDHFDHMERIDYGDGVGKVFVDVVDIWLIHIRDQVSDLSSFPGRDR